MTYDIKCDIHQQKPLSADIDVQFYSGGGAPAYNIGSGLKLDRGTNTISVDTTDVPEQDNTKPITSSGVYTTLGNIDVLLGTI